MGALRSLFSARRRVRRAHAWKMHAACATGISTSSSNRSRTVHAICFLHARPNEIALLRVPPVTAVLFGLTKGGVYSWQRIGNSPNSLQRSRRKWQQRAAVYARWPPDHSCSMPGAGGCECVHGKCTRHVWWRIRRHPAIEHRRYTQSALCMQSQMRLHFCVRHRSQRYHSA